MEVILICWGKTAAPRTMCLRGRDGEPRKKVGVTIGGSFAIFQSIAVCSEEFQPAQHSCIVFANFGEVLERFVISVDVEVEAPQIPTKTFDAPNDATCFEVERCPMALRY